MARMSSVAGSAGDGQDAWPTASTSFLTSEAFRAVSRPMRHHMAGEILARQCQVAHHVQDLVSHAFVGETKLVVDRPIGAEDQQVGLGDAAPDPRFSQRLGFFDQEERAACRQLSRGSSRARSGRRSSGGRWAYRGRNRGDRTGPARRTSPGAAEIVAPTLVDGDGFGDHEAIAGLVLLDGAGFDQGGHEGAAGAVAAGGLARVDVDHAVVDLESSERGHHVLDHLDGGLALLDGGAPLAGDHVPDVGRHRGLMRQVGPAKDDARPRVGGPEPHRDLGAGQEADAADLGLGGDRALQTRGRRTHDGFGLPFTRMA